MSSKQLSTPPPTQPRRSYENTLRTNHYQQMNIRLNSQSAVNDRTATSSYRQYPNISSRSYNNNTDYPYASSLYGINRQSSPTIVTSSPPLYSTPNRPQTDMRNQSHHPQQRHLSRSMSDDYCITRYQEINNLNGENYGDNDENGDDDDEQSSEIFNYTFHDTGDAESPAASPMASYRHIGVLNSPNINNNNNSNHHHHISSTLHRDQYDYSTNKYNQQQQQQHQQQHQQHNYKTLTMPKTHYQNITTTATTKDFLPKDNGSNYLTASSSFDSESNSNGNESAKRINNPNGKFSIQKMIRHGFSSWRTRKKPSSASSPPPPPPSSVISTNTIYSNNLTLPPSHAPLSTGRYITHSDDFSPIPPPTAARSISVDSIINRTSPPKVVNTQPIIFSSPRANSVDSVTVDFDRPPTTTRAFIHSPWSSSSNTTTNNTTTTTPSHSHTESIYRPTPVPVARVLPVQFAEQNKIRSPRSPPAPIPPPPLSSSTATPPPPSPNVPTTTTRIIETHNSTTPATVINSNPLKIPPPVAPKPDANRLTPIRTNYLNQNNNNYHSSSSVNPTPPPQPVQPPSTANITLNTIPYSSVTTTANEPRRLILPEKYISNQFKPIHDNNTIVYTNTTPTPAVRPVASSNISALQEKFQLRSSPVTTANPSGFPITITSTNTNNMSPTVNNTSSTMMNSSSTPTCIQTNKQITVQDIDTTRYEEIPAKEPDLTRRPEKSALKKPNGLKRRVIPVLRENQRPSPRPSPKNKPVVIFTSPTSPNDEHNVDNAHNENEPSPSEDDDEDDDDNDDGNNDTKKPFATVKRNDSLARFLKDRPLPNELFDKHILVKPVDERKNERETIETKLERKLSLRPSLEELEARNILRAKTQAELIAEKEEKKRYLIRKLSFRPSIQELRDRKIIRFCDYIEVSECDDVDRRADKPWTRLTPRDKQMIRKELNDYKSLEMEIHPESAKYTRFHPP
ncbi:unnamed protein product [Adineta steineri]|uniref:Phosphatase and actin regulator n=1 Tax=Adineta steineri TaxID=433720 RepID=A0A815ANL6_9BILA|nr:unnamed protein product [Adineta steineri]CAF1258521.1 unnamed protein product [Adineta steineri]